MPNRRRPSGTGGRSVPSTRGVTRDASVADAVARSLNIIRRTGPLQCVFFASGRETDCPKGTTHPQPVRKRSQGGRYPPQASPYALIGTHVHTRFRSP